MRGTVALIILFALLGGGCKKADRPTATVVLLDTSASIDKESFEQAVKVIGKLADRMKRGDRLSIIPISGQTDREVNGRIIRLELPVERQSYDADLAHKRSQLRSDLQRLRTAGMQTPAQRTDILSGLSVAAQEFGLTNGSHNVLVVLSDFLQDDSRLNFSVDHRLGIEKSAVELALEIQQGDDLKLSNVTVYLGYLKSRDWLRLPKARTKAIERFWETLLGTDGNTVEIFADSNAVLVRQLKQIQGDY